MRQYMLILLWGIRPLTDGITDDGFQKYITDFQNLSARAGITNEVTLIDQFLLGLDQQLATMILSMATIPTTVAAWIEQAKTFHAQKMHILALKGGRLPFASYSSTPRTTPIQTPWMLMPSPFQSLPPLKEPNASAREGVFTAD